MTITPVMSTGLSLSPKVSIANSLRGRGVASTARLPTASSGEVTPLSSAASASETATPAAPASSPARPRPPSDPTDDPTEDWGRAGAWRWSSRWQAYPLFVRGGLADGWRGPRETGGGAPFPSRD